MKALLESFNLSDDAISIYLKGLGKFPFTFSEIQSIVPHLSEEVVKKLITELIEKKLILLVNPKYSESIPHYITIPPFAAFLNILADSTENSDETTIEEKKKYPMIEKFQENLYHDLEKNSEDLIELLSKKGTSGQTMEILSEVEENVKKLAQVILDDVIGLISPLRLQSAVDARDFTTLINSVKQKVPESEEMVANMFSQFREIVKKLESPNIPAEVEAFKSFIKNLVDSIDKRVQELSFETSGPSSKRIHTLENSLYNLLTNYISITKDSLDKFWIVNSYEKIKEIISILLEKSKNHIKIIVPNIEGFIPLEKFNLDYSNDFSIKKGVPQKEALQKTQNRNTISVPKKQTIEILEKIDNTAKKVAELKGFELSHDIADLLALISEVNAESIVLDSIQGWLNRLLVIRKHLDSNTQYLLLEDIEKWKNDYPKIKIIESKPEQDVVDEFESNLEKSNEQTQPKELHIKIISSDPHENKYALAFAKKMNIEYLQINNNNIFAINADESSLIFGVYQKISNKPLFDLSGFFTTYKPIIEVISPLIDQITSKARYSREVEINRGFNEIIEYINDFSGRKIGKKLKNLLDVAFEKDGISLDILELKLLIGKLEKSYLPLDNEMKEYIINALNKLNNKFSSLELNYPPDFRPPILKEDGESELEIERVPPQIESLDVEKLDNLFELFLEKIESLKGIEIGEQIDKFIEIVLKLQGYSNIIEWRNSLRDIDKRLEEPFKQKIREDLLSWKLGLLHQNPISTIKLKEESNEALEYAKKESALSIFEEEYVSPGLSQSQFKAEEEFSLISDENKVDPKIKMRELFNKIQLKLGELTGYEIGKIMQNIVDIILETEGYSMILKDIKDWISKLRKIKGPLESEIKDDFQIEFIKWKDNYSLDDYETTLENSPSYDLFEDSNTIGKGGMIGTLNDKFNSLFENIQTLKGEELSNDLQSIADILLQSHGAVAVNTIRQWISKLRSIKEPLDDEVRDEFSAELEDWKEKFT
ncbi:MAG: hypothetical protein ACFFA4_04240 [Promethearchaeota archaeon]